MSDPKSSTKKEFEDTHDRVVDALFFSGRFPSAEAELNVRFKNLLSKDQKTNNPLIVEYERARIASMPPIRKGVPTPETEQSDASTGLSYSTVVSLGKSGETESDNRILKSSENVAVATPAACPRAANVIVPSTSVGTSENKENKRPGSSKIANQSITIRHKHNKSNQKTYCSFCSNNNEPEEIYMGHRLKDETGNILCPRLRKHVCPTCQATGDKAHTQKYCPRRMKPI